MNGNLKQGDLVEFPEPIGKFIIDNADGIQADDGMYYHYSVVCSLLRKYESQLEFKERGRG